VDFGSENGKPAVPLEYRRDWLYVDPFVDFVHIKSKKDEWSMVENVCISAGGLGTGADDLTTYHTLNIVVHFLEKKMPNPRRLCLLCPREMRSGTQTPSMNHTINREILRELSDMEVENGLLGWTVGEGVGCGILVKSKRWYAQYQTIRTCSLNSATSPSNHRPQPILARKHTSLLCQPDIRHYP
jgi:hypothetical protein